MATTKNLFALLESDDEDAPKIKTVAPKKEVTKTTKTLHKVAQNNNASNDGKDGNKTAKVTAREAEQEKRNDNRSMRPTRGGRGGRGAAGGRGRGGRGGDDRRDGRREFDRRSGTGRGREASKGGAGGHNWGADKDAAETTPVSEEPVDSTEEDQNSPTAEAVEEEVDNEMTLDEYLAKRESEKRSGKAFEEVEVRAIANEFQTATPLSKERTPDFIEANHEKVFRGKTSGRKKQVFENVGFRAPQPERRHYDNHRRGGRHPRVQAPNVSNVSDFPTLS